MPTYEYRCEKCDHEFEVFQRMTDPKLEDCPREDCDGHVRRLLGTGAGIIFKGSGFYETDYRSDSYKKGAKEAEKSSSSGDSSKDSSKSGGDSSSKSTGDSKKSPDAPKKEKASVSK